MFKGIKTFWTSGARAFMPGSTLLLKRPKSKSIAINTLNAIGDINDRVIKTIIPELRTKDLTGILVKKAAKIK